MLYLRSPHPSSGSSDQLYDGIPRGSLLPYWIDADHSTFNFSDTVGDVINDDNRFAVQIDVSHFRPEEMKIELNESELKIEGYQEMRSEHGS